MDFLHVRCSNIIGESIHTKTLNLGSFNEKPASTIGVFFSSRCFLSENYLSSALGVFFPTMPMPVSKESYLFNFLVDLLLNLHFPLSKCDMDITHRN